MRLLAAAALLFSLTFPNPARAATTLSPGDVRVTAGKDAHAQVLVQSDDKALLPQQLTAIDDLGSLGEGPSSLTVEFAAPQEIHRTETEKRWLAKLAVPSIPAGASYSRLAQLVFSDGTKLSLPYTLSAAPDPPQTPFSWSATTSTRTLVSPQNQSFELSVLPVGAPGTGLRIDGSSLREASTGQHLEARWLRLCPTDSLADCRKGSGTAAAPAPGSDTIPPIPAGTRRTVYVFLSPEIPSGLYTGAIGLALNESPEAKTVEVGISCSAGHAWLWGTLAIAIGAVLAWFGSTFARSAAANAEARAPAARLQGLAAMRLQDLAEYKNAVPVTQQALDDLILSLSERQLQAQGLIPSRVPSPFGSAALDAEKYQTYLNDKSTRLMALTFLIQNGLAEAWAAEIDAQDPTHPALRERALRDLDQLAKDPPQTIAELALAIPPILSRYEAQLNPPPEGAPMDARPGEPIEPRMDLQDVLFHLTLANAGAWLLAWVGTVITGVTVLILNNGGFGLPLDYAKCLLWGIGVQVVGQQMSQLSPGSVSTALGFKVPG